MSSRRIELQLPPADGFVRLQAACAQIGKVKEVNEATRSLLGAVPSGPLRSLTPALLRMSVLTGPDGISSVVEIEGQATVDPYGYERKAIDKLIAAI